MSCSGLVVQVLVWPLRRPIAKRRNRLSRLTRSDRHLPDGPEIRRQEWISQVLEGHGEIPALAPATAPRVADREAPGLEVIAARDDRVATEDTLAHPGHLHVSRGGDPVRLETLVDGEPEHE